MRTRLLRKAVDQMPQRGAVYMWNCCRLTWGNLGRKRRRQAAGRSVHALLLTMWHYQKNGAAEGPLNEQEALDLIRSGSISSQTLVWTEGMEDWSAAENTALSKFFPPPVDNAAPFVSLLPFMTLPFLPTGLGVLVYSPIG